MIRRRHYSIRTEKSYVSWIKRFILFHNKRHPKDLGPREIEEYLTHLAENRRVSASTQNQAFNAILFLYEQVLRVDADFEINAVRAKRPQRMPSVLTRSEANQVIEAMSGPEGLVVRLLYGSGLRLSEALRLRVRDLDFEMNQILVRDAKGQKDRVTLLPESVRRPLKKQLVYARGLHREDLSKGFGRVALPNALARKYPNAEKEWSWQYVFPASRTYRELDTGVVRRHRLHESTVQRALRRAALGTEIAKPVHAA